MSTKERKKTMLADKVTGRPLMTTELFFKLMLRYKLLTQPEAMKAFETGILPSDIMDRILKLVEKERQN